MENTLMIYDYASGQFRYPYSKEGEFSSKVETHPLWQIIAEDGFASENTAERFKNKIQEIAEADTPQVHFEEYFIKNAKQVRKWYRVGFICPAPGETINITFSDIDGEEHNNCHWAKTAEYDELTGLLNRKAFCKVVN